MRTASSKDQTVTVAAPRLITLAAFLCLQPVAFSCSSSVFYFTLTPPTALSVTLADHLQNRLPRKNAELLGVDKMDVHDFPSLAIRGRKTIGFSRSTPGLLISNRVRRRCIVCCWISCYKPRPTKGEINQPESVKPHEKVPGELRDEWLHQQTPPTLFFSQWNLIK